MYLKELSNSSSTYELDSIQSLHIATVLRLKEGATIELFNGEGLSCEANILLASKRGVQIELNSKITKSEKSKGTLIGVLPYIKKENLFFMTQKLTEMGISELIFFKPENLDQSLVKKDLSKLKDKLNDVVIGACKQSGINFLPKIEHYNDLKESLDNSSALGANNFVCFFDLEASKHLSRDDIADKEACIFITGPESGFSDQERFTMLAKDISLRSLGKNILRAETAPIISITLFQSFLGNL